MKYLILQNPGHNRVYYKSADQLALAELRIAAQGLSVACEKTEITELKGVRYLGLELAGSLSSADLMILSRLSFAFAIFEVRNLEDQEVLIPVAKNQREYLDPKVNMILKYQGKTNELFTRMMIHVALLTSDFSQDETVCLLDPVAGKGTTLFEAAVYGIHAYGIEIDPKPVHESVVFFRKYLEDERIKHKLDKHRVSGTNKNNAVLINEFQYALSKDDFAEGKVKRLGMITGKTSEAHRYFKKEQFHLIVGDLPYGISHGNSSSKSAGSGSRNPVELIRQSVASWYQVLRRGGAIAVAWNTYVLDKHMVAKIFEAAGFEVQTESPYNNFEHLVDKAIRRDILVARKKRSGPVQ